MELVENKNGIMPRLVSAIVSLCGGTWASRAGHAPRRLQVLETLPVGPMKQLLLISCDGERYLVATGPDSVQTIMRVESHARAVEPAIVAAEFGVRS